jgi:chemotaxis protein MotB
MAANNPQTPVIIIRKKKRGGHGGHHGGAWKVAYADFVTAMMSFFLLLWLLNVTTDIERKGIADYFAPASISKSESGAGGVMGGQTITTNGAQISYATPPTTQDVTIPTIGQGNEGDEETKGKDQGGGEGKSNANANAASGADASKDALAVAVQHEEETFKQAQDLLMQAIVSNPELRDFANQISIDRTPEGLRIQITDRDKLSMFPSGGAVPYEKARDLLILIGKVITKLPNAISVTGHTDSAPFVPGSGHDNWTLSTARANISREYLVSAGVDEKRVARVSGLADRDPFVAADPKDPRNRRISIVLLRQTNLPPELSGMAPAAPAPADAVPVKAQ